MEYNNLPKIFTVQDIADYFKVDEKTVLDELEAGRLNGLRLGKEWRATEEEILRYVRRGANVESSDAQERADVREKIEADIAMAGGHDWSIQETGPFDFNWPNKGGGTKPEHYDQTYEATGIVRGEEYTFRIGFGNRDSAGQPRRRVTIWLGTRALVEFAGSNNYEEDGLLAGIIRLKNGKQLTTQRIPDEYKGFKLVRYNEIVKGPRASTGMAVTVKKTDFHAMLKHAVIRASWKGLLK